MIEPLERGVGDGSTTTDDDGKRERSETPHGTIRESAER
jgi:hypothetical protein